MEKERPPFVRELRDVGALELEPEPTTQLRCSLVVCLWACQPTVQPQFPHLQSGDDNAFHQGVVVK